MMRLGEAVVVVGNGMMDVGEFVVVVGNRGGVLISL
jgi:hypothetical protein